MIYWWALVIFLTSLLVFLVAGAVTSRPGPPFERMADPLPLPGELVMLPRPGAFEVEYLPGPPFAGADRGGYDRVDTGPLLILSEKAAANAALEREVRAMIEAAEREIGPTP